MVHDLADSLAECLVVIQLRRVHHYCGAAHGRMPSRTANTNADALTTAGGARERLATEDMGCQLPVANGFTQRVSLLAATVAVTVRVVDAAGTIATAVPGDVSVPVRPQRA